MNCMADLLRSTSRANIVPLSRAQPKLRRGARRGGERPGPSGRVGGLRLGWGEGLRLAGFFIVRMYPSIHEQGDLDEGQEAEQRIAAHAQSRRESLSIL
jgi:hypothetical protein